MSGPHPLTPPPSHPTLPTLPLDVNADEAAILEEGGEENGTPGAGKPQLDSLMSRWSGGSYLSAFCPIDLAVPELPREPRARRWSSFSQSVQIIDGKGIPQSPSAAAVQRASITSVTSTSARRDSEKSQAQSQPSSQSEKKSAHPSHPPRPIQQNDYFDQEAVSPLSHPAQLSPLSPLMAEPSLTPPRILWTNKPYEAITGRTPLSELVDATPLAAFRTWLLGSGLPSPEFTLGLGTGVELDLVKTVQTGIQNTYAVVTSVRMNEAKQAARKASTAVSSPAGSPRPQKPRPLDTTEELRPLITRSGRRRGGRRTPPTTIPRENGLPPPPRNDNEERLSCTQLLQDTKWEETPAGPIKDWPPEVHSMIRLIFMSSDQDSIWVGSDMRLV